MSTQLAKNDNQPIAAVATPATLLQMAIEGGADLDRLERLMTMQTTWEANEAKKSYTAAMSQFSAECPTIEKTETVQFSGTLYTHASIAGTLEQIRGLMAENGLSHSWRVNQENGGITVTCYVKHVLGHQERTSMTAPPDGSGKKNQIQQIASTVTYLERYTLFAILGLASAEQDDDAVSAVSVQYITENQAADIEALISEVGADKQAFLKHFKIESILTLSTQALSMALDMLDRKRK